MKKLQTLHLIKSEDQRRWKSQRAATLERRCPVSQKPPSGGGIKTRDKTTKHKGIKQMKTIQIEANKSDNNDILRAAGVKRIHAGWYSVTYNGVRLDNSTVTGAARNRKGEIRA